jgi:hypothetical protein
MVGNQIYFLILNKNNTMATSIEQVVKYYIKKDLTGDEIRKLTGKYPILYSDLKNYNVKKLLKGVGDFQVILLQTLSKIEGHFVAVIDRHDGVYYFDSYGLGSPDSYKEYTKFDQQYPNYLSKLLQESGKQIISNYYNYQSWNAGISTCGRYSALRIHLLGLNNDEFHSLFVNNQSKFLSRPDYVVTILTLTALNNINQIFDENN